MEENVDVVIIRAGFAGLGMGIKLKLQGDESFVILEKAPNSYFDLKASVQEEYNKEIQAKLSTMVWSNGRCNSYYLQNHDGKNTSIWPGSTVKYRKRTKRIKMADYNICTPEGQKTKENVEPLIPTT